MGPYGRDIKRRHRESRRLRQLREASTTGSIKYYCVIADGTMTYSRISVTLPEDLLIAADRKAEELERPRSWVVAEALRTYLAHASEVQLGRGPSVRSVASEPAPEPYAAAEVAEARLRHLEAELRLPPAERLRRAEELGRLARGRQHRGRRHQIIGFDTYEDYYEWKKARLVGV